MEDTTPTPGAPSDNTTLTAVVGEFAAFGYDGDFAVIDDDGAVRCRTCTTVSSPDAFAIAAFRRLEGASDPADMAALAAMECPVCHARGSLVIRFGPEADAGHDAVMRAMALSDETPSVPVAVER